MSAKFGVVARGNPSDPTAPKKYYPSLRSTDRLTLRQLTDQISSASTVSAADTVAVLEALLGLVPQALANGHIIELGDLGTFSLRIRTEGAETPEQVGSRHIVGTTVSFRPSKYLKNSLNTISFQKLSK